MSSSGKGQAKYTAELREYGTDHVKRLCWGMLAHMLGLSDDAKHQLDRVGNDGVPPALKALTRELHRYNISPENEREGILVRVVECLGVLLNPEKCGGLGPAICRESPRCFDEREAIDDPDTGYCRDPFKKLGDNEEPRKTLALAAISYLVRAHALFFCRPRRFRDFNAAKVALNDIFQATQLGCRLYYSLEKSHLYQWFHDTVEYDPEQAAQESYFKAVRDGSEFETDPWTSPLFIWSVLDLVEIQRGNIYRQVDYVEEADRCYRHAQRRLDRLCNKHLRVDKSPIVSPSDKYFITPTTVKALFERSKVLFDKGLFVESMISQLRCLGYLIQISKEFQCRGAALRRLKELSEAMEFLDVVRRQSVWDKESITSLFGLPSELSPVTGGDPISPESLATYMDGLSSSDAQTAVEVLARLGFTIFLLCRRGFVGAYPRRQTARDNADFDQIERTLLPFFQSHMKEGLKGKAKSSALARYCLKFIVAGSDSGSKGRSEDVEFPDHLERQLAHRLGQTMREESRGGEGHEDRDFYRSVFGSVTVNIGNLLTIPRRVQSFLMRPGYRERRLNGDLSRETVCQSLPRELLHHARGYCSEDDQDRVTQELDGKLVVLRRWQSYNPKIPRPYGAEVRGGGYFLLWNGKGIVIDPGYDFIQNFYDEGFSLNDIDAVIVTHSHPDHDDDLSSLTTLVREWNEYHSLMGYASDAPATDDSTEAPVVNQETMSCIKRLDVFLNESTHLKFSNWLRASKVGLARIIPLPLVVWNMESENGSNTVRGENVVLNLRKRYGFDLEVIPARHDDVIGRTSAVGLKFVLHSKDAPTDASVERKTVPVIGYTGDTGMYGELPWEESGGADLNIQKNYEDCDVLVAHLGDIRLRELATVLKEKKKAIEVCECISGVLTDWFHKAPEEDTGGTHRRDDPSGVDEALVNGERVDSFLRMLVDLRVAPKWALETRIPTADGKYTTASGALRRFVDTGELGLEEDSLEPDTLGRELTSHIPTRLPANYDQRLDLENQMRKILETQFSNTVHFDSKQRRHVYLLLAFLCASSLKPWSYENHLGVSGILQLHKAMVQFTDKQDRDRLFVVGELPEELASYRHFVAKHLNAINGYESAAGSERGRTSKGRVFSFTGDIGLHVKLGSEEGEFAPKIRCAYCNYNNETVLAKANYHPLSKVKETALKRLNSAMIYLCTTHDHHPDNLQRPADFLSRPNLRVI